MISRFFLGLLIILSTSASTGAVLYYITGLSLLMRIASLLVGGAALFAYTSTHAQRGATEDYSHILENMRMEFHRCWPALLTLVIDAVILAAVFWSATTDAIRSPWEVIPPIVFLLYALSTALLLRQTNQKRFSILHSAFCIPLHFFTTLAVSAIIFPLGFGFDQILHQAAEKVIAVQDVILPKTPYYIGQYALVTLLHTVSRIPIETIDRFLVPAFAAIFLPPLLAPRFAIKDKLRVASCELPTAAFLLFALPFLTLTTPFNLALLWLLFTVLLARGDTDHWIVGLMALTSFAIHPMVGIPALIFAMLWELNRRGSLTATRAIAIAALGSLMLPAILFHLGAEFNWPSIPHPALDILHSTFVFHRFDTVRDFIYSFNALRIATLLLLTGFTFKKRASADRPFWFAAFSALLSSLILITLTSFPNVAGYENLNFSTRLLTVSFILLLPLLLQSLISFMDRLHITHYQLLITFTVTLTASWYLLYPRVDDGYVVAHGYTISANDIEAVHKIEQDAGSTPYIVLSTQAVAAAAIREFGFKRYYRDTFYYSIPTGAALYQDYLKFVYRSPTADTVHAAMNRAGVPRAYVVLNRYWTNAPAIAVEASRSASSVQTIAANDQNIKIWIFRYDR